MSVDGKCQQCGTELVRKQYPNGHESDRELYLRKFCDRQCRYDWQKKGGNVQRWALNHYAHQLVKETCESCGTKYDLHVHHKDRNIRNNEESNLMTLCNSCHMKLHHKQGRELPPRNANNSRWTRR